MKKCLYRDAMRELLWFKYKFFLTIYFPLYRTWIGKKCCDIANKTSKTRDTKYSLTDEEKEEINRIGCEFVEEFLKENNFK